MEKDKGDFVIICNNSAADMAICHKDIKIAFYGLFFHEYLPILYMVNYPL